MSNYSATFSPSPPKPAVPPLATVLLLSLLWGMTTLAAGWYRGTYDAYIHMFFASHYARHWFDTWNTGWYGGFDLASYPPLTHQLIALLSPRLGLLKSYQIVQLVGLPVLATGAYRFSRVWTDERAALHAGVAAVMLTSVAQAVHQWGQLPTTFAAGFLLHGIASLHAWQAKGERGDAAVAALCFLVTLTAHHLTIIFGAPFFGAALVLDLARRTWAQRSLTGEGKAQAMRLAGFVAGFGAIAAAVLSPFLVYVIGHRVSQVPIAHASRANFLENFQALCLFWLVPWGSLLCFFPAVVSVARRRPDMHGPFLAFAVLTLLGLSGTIPPLRWALGPVFDILTFDRFTFWASLAILPFVGVVVAECGGTAATLALVTSLVLGNALYLVGLRHYKFQPDPIAMRPMVTYLEPAARQGHRYLTLGFGSQLAWLSALTRAQSVDGLYHTARPTEVLRQSGIEALDGAKYFGDGGLATLRHYLEEAPRYHLRHILNADPFYDALLDKAGWRKGKTLAPGITAWTKDGIPPIPAGEVQRESDLPRGLRVLWGLYPLFLLALAVAAAWRWTRGALAVAPPASAAQGAHTAHPAQTGHPANTAHSGLSEATDPSAVSHHSAPTATEPSALPVTDADGTGEAKRVAGI